MVWVAQKAFKILGSSSDDIIKASITFAQFVGSNQKKQNWGMVKREIKENSGEI
jgi:hypothetical protein